MRLRLDALNLTFQRASVAIEFGRFTYFWGKMGAGKSSIARLVDYCLGGDMEPTPALQKEFVSAKLFLTLGTASVSIYRDTGSSKATVAWEDDGELFEVLIPAKGDEGEVLPDTGVAILSDLIFHLAGVTPPKVRRSKRDEESPLIRLSFRDLFWYCYLDQDGMDSDFFSLGADSHPFKRLKSLDAFRFVLGFHQEEVAYLESRLQELREQRLAKQAGAEALQSMLRETGFSSVIEIQSKIEELHGEISQLRVASADVRLMQGRPTHAVDELRKRGRNLAGEVSSLETALIDIRQQADTTERLRNELLMLSVKFRRSAAARDVLSGVAFAACPRCAQDLPARPVGCCTVCGQDDDNHEHLETDDAVLNEDLRARLKEVSDSLVRLKRQDTGMRSRLDEFIAEKDTVDMRLDAAMKQYDSAYLSRALELERHAASLSERIANLERQKLLPAKLDDQFRAADKLIADETEVRRKLVEARKKAEKDVSNLKRLEELFLDCLVRARFPGIKETDVVSIASPHYLPVVTSPETGDLATTSFANLGSGGKKCVFKACYALAIHRLAQGIDADLPPLLVIDSPMKNISERENEDVFSSFYEMVYELAADELATTQFLIIDKEFRAPRPGTAIEVGERHMMPDSADYPPLIPYYRGL